MLPIEDPSTRVRTLRLAFLVIAALLIATLAAAFAMGRMTILKAREVSRQRVVLDSLHALVATLADAETGQRGYLLTGGERRRSPAPAAASSPR